MNISSVVIRYFLSKIMYGEDRLTRPLLRMRGDKFDKNGEFTPITWKQAFEIMAEKWKASLKKGGPSAVGMFGSGQWTIWEGYAAAKLYKAGFRSNNLDPNARHCMASAVAGFMRTFGIDEPMGCYDDLEHADGFVLWGANMAEMHPILWSRLTDRRLTHNGRGARSLHVREPQLRARRQPDDLRAADRPRDPQFHRQLHHPEQRGKSGFRRKHVAFAHTVEDIGYGLRPDHPLEVKAVNGSHKAGRTVPRIRPGSITFEQYKKLVAKYTLDYAAKLSGVEPDRLLKARQALRRSEEEGRVLLDHGVQPAHARHLGEQPRLQRPPADRENLRARQRAVLAHRPAVRLRHRARGRYLRAPPAGRHGRDQSGAPRDRGEDLAAARPARCRETSATTPWCSTGCSRTASSTPTG